ncbi:hypothetical protein [Desulfofustis limnaeus]|jgi:hypothetical protein|uniref:hypothetical protein n=1 Tax=Desulfofustis limnaeus TaxID=2740163 RepID=UPI0024E03A3F|nr:hypothetical protein [Desulfofustis limnaeus]MDX9896556.1 hypothetical protein [Desulfofustis sp.]
MNQKSDFQDSSVRSKALLRRSGEEKRPQRSNRRKERPVFCPSEMGFMGSGDVQPWGGKTAADWTRTFEDDACRSKTKPAVKEMVARQKIKNLDAQLVLR